MDKPASDQDLNASTFQTYLYLVKAGKPVGPRDVMRGANLSSPSVAYRNLQKLMDLGLVIKDVYGNYVVKERVEVKGYVWFGRTLIPRFVIFGFIFIGVLIGHEMHQCMKHRLSANIGIKQLRHGSLMLGIEFCFCL